MTDLSGQNTIQENASLIDRYYAETDPAKRKDLLTQMAEHPDACFSFRKQLYDARFLPVKGEPSRFADQYLLAFMDMIQASKNAVLFGGGKKRMQKTLSIFTDLEQKVAAHGAENELRREMENAVTRYLETCMSPTYQRKLFGTITLDDEERGAHIRKDAYAMSYGLAARFDLTEECTLLCETVSAAYRKFAPEDTPLKNGENVGA